MSIEKKSGTLYMDLPFEVKEMSSDDEYFYFEGYGSTADLDQVKDITLPTSMAESLLIKTPVLLWQHSSDCPIGMPRDENGCTIDSKGLYVRGKLPLADDFVRGRVVPQLKCRSVKSMSIGYQPIEWNRDLKTGIRTLTKIDLWEISLVTFPCNTAAQIKELKSLSSIDDGIIIDKDNLPKKFAEKSYRWESADAEKRVRSWSGSNDEPNDKYKSAFIAVSGDDSEYSSYKMQIGDIIDGELKAIPRAIFSARVALTINGGDPKSKSIINDLYKDMGIEQPFDDNGTAKAFFQVEISNMRKSDLTKALRHGNVLSADSASMVASALLKHTETSTPVGTEKTDFVEELKKLSRITQNATEDIHGRI